MGFVLDLSVLFFSVLVVTIILMGISLGVMYGMHKYMADKLTETTYIHFDFDSYQKQAFSEMMVRLALIIGLPTIILPIVERLIFDLTIRRYPVIICAVVTLFEVAALAAGFRFMMKLDSYRTTMLTLATGLVYLILLATFLYYKMS